MDSDLDLDLVRVLATQIQIQIQMCVLMYVKRHNQCLQIQLSGIVSRACFYVDGLCYTSYIHTYSMPVRSCDFALVCIFLVQEAEEASTTGSLRTLEYFGYEYFRSLRQLIKALTVIPKIIA